MVFFKRFTQEEEEYAEVTQKARGQIRAIYNDEIVALKAELSSLNEKIADKQAKKTEIRMKIRDINKRLTVIENAIIEEAKPQIKEYFDYQIPIAKVEDAGITSTGAVSSHNQLKPLQEEYKAYRHNNQLWQENHSSISYTIKKDGRLYRILDGKEEELKW